MGRSGLGCRQFGVVDCSGCRASGCSRLRYDCKEESQCEYLDDYSGYGGAIWGYVTIVFKYIVCADFVGFMTFCPEWLTGNGNLDGSNFMFL